MAERRMFAKTIIDSDAFLEMPISTQALYFHLSMRADDDGFVNNPIKIQRMTGCSTDDLKLLCAKKFILLFDSGVVVVKHWRINNLIRSDRYKPTVYVEEKRMLVLTKSNVYTLNENYGCLPHPDGSFMQNDNRSAPNQYPPGIPDDNQTPCFGIPSGNQNTYDGIPFGNQNPYFGIPSDNQYCSGIPVGNQNGTFGIPSDNQNMGFGIPTVAKRETQYSIGKDSIGKDNSTVENSVVLYRTDSETESKPKTQNTKTRTPTLQDVSEYIASKGYCVSAERFFSYYESVGWVIGNGKFATPIRNWKAKVDSWEETEKAKASHPVTYQPQSVKVNQSSAIAKELLLQAQKEELAEGNGC